MLHLTILGSGSAGNCALLETPRCRLLVDGGLSTRQIALRLQQCGVNPLEIDGILLTHEHSDHAGCLEVWSKEYATPIYCNSLTAESLGRGRLEAKRDWRIFQTGAEFSIGDLTVQSFSVPHDAVDPVGFVFQHDGEALGFLTDLGVATKLACERIRHVSTLVIETNHDEKLLQNDLRRPWSIKQRIMSRHGHLSNAAAAEVLAGLMGGGSLRRAVLGHLSRDCNSPELAIGAVRARMTSSASRTSRSTAPPSAKFSPASPSAAPPLSLKTILKVHEYHEWKDLRVKPETLIWSKSARTETLLFVGISVIRGPLPSRF